MQWLEPGNVLLRWPTWRSKSHETTPLEALEDPAPGGSSGRFAHLAGHRLLRRGELFAQAMFGESVHEQTQHHHPAQGDNPLRTRDEDGGGQEQGVFSHGTRVWSAWAAGGARARSPPWVVLARPLGSCARAPRIPPPAAW